MNEAAVSVRRIRRLMCLFTALLIASTWRLWTPGSQFPQIPWLARLCSVREGWWDWIPLVAAAVWLALEFRGLPCGSVRTWIVRSLLWVPIAFALLADQHRLQPWVWQMLLMAGVLGVADEPTAIRCLRWLTVSIYFHSAVSKVDLAFLDSHGQWLLDGLASSLGLSTALWSETTRRILAALLPVGEFAVAATLLFRRTRRIGLVLAIAMHVMLLLTLGPFGQAQKPAVLLWNIFFIALDVLLFGRNAASPASDNRTPLDSFHGLRNRVAVAGTLVLFALPCLSWWGYWDHWPSWAVYSSRPAIVQLFVPEESVQDLPSSLRPFVGPPEPLGELCPVNLDAWSFAMLDCPMYPQDRYRMAVASAVAAESGLQRVKVVIQSSPNRWTGERTQTVLQGDRAALAAYNRRHYWWNTRARDGLPLKPPDLQN